MERICQCGRTEPRVIWLLLPGFWTDRTGIKICRMKERTRLRAMYHVPSWIPYFNVLRKKRYTLGHKNYQFQDYEKSIHIHCNLQSVVWISDISTNLLWNGPKIWLPCNFKEYSSFACISDANQIRPQSVRST